jgi:hypothetical protein
MDKLLNYLKIQIALKKITKEEVLAKYPKLEGKI